ncbi:hypothetical protein, partial [Salmonella enterica]|uniref:hypothetical protein n=1 Tax=Salmonella enterica TaxID=28901 RepID=UPI003075D546
SWRCSSFKPAYPSQSYSPVFGRGLNDEQRQALAERMRARPYAYVAQELALRIIQTGVPVAKLQLGIWPRFE